jgi:hypothetical protein
MQRMAGRIVQCSGWDRPRFTPHALRANTRIVEVLNEFGKTRG